ncbi:SDR family NAD(P)-dependent oxidoreductase [Streptomyces sp. 900116325]
MFWLAAAVSALSLLAVAVLVPPSRPACGGHTDWRGAAGLTVALVLLLFPLSRATVWGWASGWTSGCLAASAVAAMFWVRVEPAGSPTSPRPPAASPTRPTSLGDSPPRSQPRTTKLDVLVNNAGIGFHAEGTERQTSADGYELRLAVNYLAPVALTRELLPLLHRATPSRIVNIASMGQQPVHLDDPQPTREYTDVAAYRRSKLALICPTVDLAEELSGTGITVNSLHPATFMPTNMSRQTGLDVVDSLEQGVAATRRLVDLPELAGVTGRYFDGEQEGRAAAEAYDREYRRRLAAVTESLL